MNAVTRVVVFWVILSVLKIETIIGTVFDLMDNNYGYTHDKLSKHCENIVLTCQRFFKVPENVP